MKALFKKIFEKNMQLKYIFDAYQPDIKTLVISDTKIIKGKLDKPENSGQMQTEAFFCHQIKN